MKKPLFIFFIILTSIQSADAQWMNQNSGTNRTLYDIEFLNNKTGWVVGVNGTIRKTTNGGVNWFNIVHPVGTRLLSSIHLVDSNYAYVVGDFETIIKTTDGGKSWIIIRYGAIGVGDSYEGVFFINKDTGWICGNGNKVLRTSDGGVTMDSSVLFWPYLQDMYFKDSNTGVLVAELGGTFKTTDSGLSWFRTTISLPTNQPSFRKVTFINNDTGWIVGGDGRVFRTSNCGSSWDSIYHLNTLPNVMYCAEFINYNTGWIGGEAGIIYVTSNSGQSWIRQQSNTSNLITSMFFYNDSLGWASCGFGGILNTTNGGLTYINIQETEINNFKLFQNFPNPFNPSTIINYELKNTSNIILKVYDVLGNELSTLVDEIKIAGIYSVIFNGNNFPSGVYFYKISSGNFQEIKKMILIK